MERALLIIKAGLFYADVGSAAGRLMMAQGPRTIGLSRLIHWLTGTGDHAEGYSNTLLGRLT